MSESATTLVGDEAWNAPGIDEMEWAQGNLQNARDKHEQRRAFAVAASLDGLWEWDLTSDALDYSDRLLELLGYTPGEVPATLDFFRHRPPRRRRGRGVGGGQQPSPRPHAVRHRVPAADSVGRLSLVPVPRPSTRDAAGHPIWMAGCLQDITDRKRAEEAMEAALAENEKLRGRLEHEKQILREQVVLKQAHSRIIGQSDALKRVLSEVERVAATDTPVLLLGETGTGKELLAQAVHELSGRKDRTMVIVNCASLPATLIESELFGREAGAYTGAASAQVGRFDLAHGSTLFFDEIGELPLELQAKLLRVLQDGRFERLGSPKTITVNVRIIAATNRNLEQALRDGKFRADLYHRLNVFPIRVPPLRERRDDIPLLVWAFVEALGRRMGKTIKSISRRTLEQLRQYSWPGNVRELSNVIERAMILTAGDALRVDVPSVSHGDALSRMTLKEGEREQISRVLQDTGWRIRGASGAAEILGIKPTTLEARMAKLRIKRPKRDSTIS